MKKLLKILTLILVIIILIAGILTFYLYHKSSATLNGIKPLKGLQGPVYISQDKNGVTYIKAIKSDNDAFFALGYAEAQSRFWQMEFQRRLATGNLSSLFGSSALPVDEYMRTLRLKQAATSAWNALTPKTKSLIQSYTNGINAYLKSGKLPIACILLNDKPRPWTDVDSVILQKVLAWDLQGAWEYKIKNYLLRAKGIKNPNLLLSPKSYQTPTILSDQDLLQSKLIATPSQHASTPATQAKLRALIDYDRKVRTKAGMKLAPGKGSNNWVISGRLTATGKPILANDPHLDLSAPNLWFLVCLKGPHIDVTGATIPGLPAIIIGHNQSIAWGMTNVNPDSQDLYILSKHTKLRKIITTINVRDGKKHREVIQESKFGPIVSSLLHTKLGPNVALRWNALQPADTTVQSLIDIDYAQNWKQFTRALSYFVTPAQNFVYADKQGNIGYHLAGRIPVRSSLNTEYPIQGNKNTWLGYIPFGKLPHVYNPKKGFIVTANNDATSNKYPYFSLIKSHEPALRAKRITQLIEKFTANHKKITLQENAVIQHDTLDLIWPRIKTTLLSYHPANKNDQEILSYLTHWNGMVTTKSIGATIFEVWYFEINKDLITTLGVHNINLSPPYIYTKLHNNQTLLAKSFKQAVKTISHSLRHNPANWAWGKLHQAVFPYLGLGQIPVLGGPWFRHIASPGDPVTVDVGTFNQRFRQDHGPSYRQLIDLANFNNSRYIIALGESENLFSPFYDNLLKKWANGGYIKISSQTAKESTLELLPIKN